MRLSLQQDEIARDCSRWMDAPIDDAAQIKRLFGFAGTGKTTIAKTLVEGSHGQWLFAAYTGKASYVMRQKGCDGAQTIHSLIYRPNGNKKDTRISELEHKLAVALKEEQDALAAAPKIAEDDQPNRTESGINFAKLGAQMKRDKDAGVYEAHQKVARLESALETAKKNERRQPAFQIWEGSPLWNVDGIVIDECSMVDAEVGEDLKSFGKKILVIGDPAQLPPVGSGGYFTNHEPDWLLTEVHRQAKDSGILELATFVREGGDILARAQSRWSTSDCRIGLKGDIPDLKELSLAADQIIVGRNESRHAYNKRIRDLIGRKSPWPEENDRVICLRNNKNAGLLNGGMWRVAKAAHSDKDDTIGMEIVPEDMPEASPMVVSCWEHPFVNFVREKQLREKGWNRNDEEEFAYAFAVTCHKFQGSQADKVVVFDESRVFNGADIQRRWLYTAITRAAKKLVVVV